MGLNEKFFKSADEDGPFFNTVLWDGQATSKSVTGVGFTPDFIWLKCRDVINSHVLADSVRGGDATRLYFSQADKPDAQATTSNQIKQIDSDGFTLFGDISATNRATQEYVGWCWKAGGAAVSNTDGSITSQVSANVANGFSIAKWTGAALIGDTVGHGLSSPPEMIILKATSATRNWNVFNDDVGLSKNLHLNTADTANTDESWAVNSNTFAIQDQSASEDLIAYCFHSVAGVSKVGSYTGNGNANGTVVPLGFEPAWVMIKGADEASDWIIIDNKRDTTNPNSARLDADNDGAEYNGEDIMDLDSTSFQLKTSSASKNANGKTFIYLAFAV